MRLIRLGINGFRRLVDVNLDLAPAVVAVVGPNQAGKSSILDALVSMDGDEPIAFVDKTRGQTTNTTDVVLTATYRLESADYDAIAHLDPNKATQFIRRLKRADGSRVYETEPRLQRDLGPRRRALVALEREDERLRVHLDGDEEALAELSGVREALGVRAQTLGSPSLEAISSFADRIQAERASRLGRLRSRLEQAAEAERAPHPHGQAVTILAERLPTALLFDESERDLRAEYDLDAVAEDCPPALANLVALAGLDLKSLQDAVARSDDGAVGTIEELADARLKSTFESVWRQAPVTVRLKTAGTRLSVLVRTSGGRWASIAESSDGLRQFVALLAFTAMHPTEPKPVLLIDEAETHLHYDAQADLVRVLERQEQASSVVYTTHSAGCLPGDLGRGVRVVETIPGSDHSRIINGLWRLGPGFAPVMLAMGASALAFSSTRHGVIGEGATEMLLLPTLLREATGLRVLPFQVAPGLSEASPSALASLDLDAARVAYVVDGDQGGVDRGRHLTRLGVPRRLVVSLPGGTCIEDCVRPDVYRDALNSLLRERGETVQFRLDELPTKRRAAFVDLRCRAIGIRAVPHAEVAIRLLEMQPTEPLTDAQGRRTLHSLYNRLAAALGLTSLSTPPARRSRAVAARRPD